MTITSKDNPLFKKILKLQQKKYRNLEKQFLVEGHHLVEEAFAAKCLRKIITTEFIEKYQSIEQIIISENLMNLLKTTVTSQKIFGICNFLKTPAKIGNNVVFLNKLQDPGNIGTIIRMCRSFDIDTLILQNCDLYNEKIIRASQGAIFKLNILSVKNTEILKELKQNSYQVFGTKLDENANKINDVDFSKIHKKVIVFGNEGAGIDQEIDGLMDKSIYIPISFESLNVACAAAIVLNKLRNG